MNPCKLAALAAIVGCVAAFPARGADGLRGANTAALGGAAVAHPSDNSAIAANGAMLAMTERYDLAGTFGFDFQGNLGGHVSAMDSTRGRVGFGMAWERTIAEPPLTDDALPGWVIPGQTPSNVRRTSRFTAGMGVALDDDRTWALGLSGSMGTVRHDRLGRRLIGDLDVSAAWRPADPLTVGVVLQDLLPFDGGDTPMSALAGVRYALEDGPAVALDAGWRFDGPGGTGPVVRGGLEAAAGTARPRLGFAYDGPARQTLLTGGIGAENDRGAVAYALLVPLGAGLSPSAVRHLLTLRVFTE